MRKIFVSGLMLIVVNMLASSNCLATKNISKKELLGTKFVADQSPPYNLEGMTANLHIKKDGSFALTGSILKKFCETETVREVYGKNFELTDSYDRQVLVLKPKNHDCREMQGFISKISAEQKEEMKREFEELPEDEQEDAREEFQKLLDTELILMLCYGSLADGQLIMMPGETIK